MNKIIYTKVSSILVGIYEFALSIVHGKENGMELAKKIKLAVYELFHEYNKIFQVENGCDSTVTRNISEDNESVGAKKNQGWIWGSILKAK